jgi:predicted dehydrogenase
VNPLRIAVVGGGRLGRIHARLLGQNPDYFLAAVVDTNERTRQELAAECKAAVLASHRPLLGQIDAAIVAATTREHYALGRELMRAGIHVLMEKPLAATADEAKSLVETAKTNHVILQAGHVERFNPAFEAAAPRIGAVRHLRAVRRSGYTGRSTDVGVVYDLMIHDIDVALSLAGEEVTSVAASGHCVFGPHEDVAEARLVFASGATACLYASRVSFDPCRRLEVDGEDSLTIVDFQTRSAKVATHGSRLAAGSLEFGALSEAERTHLTGNLFQDPELFPLADLAVADTNPIAQEHDDFASAIREGRPPRVDGRQALAAMEVAERVLLQISAHAGDAQQVEPAPFTIPGKWRRAA